MPFSKYLNNNNVETAPANAAGAFSAYNPFEKLIEDQDKLNSKLKSNVIDFLTSDTGIKSEPIIGDWEDFSEYNVYLSDNKTREELEAERANNQSALEQTGKAIVNSAAEIFLGIPIGFADIADALINIGNENNDYQNFVSSNLTELKKAINERMKVYQEHPEQALDADDWGWWMTHAPSVVSSISLMVPAMGVTGVLGKIGKIAGRGLSYANKFKPFNKLANKFTNSINISNRTKDTLSAMGIAAVQGSTMRIGENYMEARETYNQVKDYATNELASMSEEDRNEFFTNNPQYVGMSDEEISNDIAANSADVTFTTDLINGVFDIVQIYGMRNVWNNRITRDVLGSARLNRVNKTAAKMFGKDAKAIEEAAKGVSLLDKTKIGIVDFLSDSARLARTEWTEGIEEAINYISSQEGIYAGKKVFDKDIEGPYIEEYLKDPYLWESALWGVIGGVVFGTAYPATMKAIEKLKAKSMNKEWISAEKQKEAEIYSRIAITENYVKELETIDSGINPFDNNRPIEPNEVNALKELAGKKYIDALVVNAANAGNLDLLESFMKDSNFTKGFREKLNITEENAIETLKQFETTFNDTKDVYKDVLNKASRAGASFEVAKLVASEAVDSKHSINSWSILRDNSKRKLDSLLSQSHLSEEINSYIEDAKDGIILQEVERKRKEIETLRRNPVVSKKSKEESLAEAQKDIDRLNKIRNVEGLDEKTIKTKIEFAKKLFKEQKEIYNAFVELAQRENVVNYAKETIKTDDVSIKNKVIELNNFLNSARKKIVDGAFEDITNMYRKYGKTEVDAQLNKQSNNISDEDKKIIDNAITALKLDEEGNKILAKRLKEISNITEIERNRADKNVTDVISDEKETSGEDTTDTSSTGGVQETSATQTQSDIVFREITSNIPETTTDQVAPTQGVQVPPPVEDGENVPVSAIDTETTSGASAIKIPEDENEQWELADEIANNLLDEVEDDILFDSTKSTEVINSISTRLTSLGFKKNIATNVVAGIVYTYTGQIATAATDIEDTSNVVINLSAFKRNKKDDYLFKALEEFVNTEFEGKHYGRSYNGRIYISMSDLMSYLKGKVYSDILYKEIFDNLKAYLFSANNKKYFVTDADTIRAIDKYNIDDYILLYNRAKKQLIKNLSNEVNIDSLFEGTDEQVAQRIVEFSKLQKDKELSVEYEPKSKRLYIRRKGRDLGYIGSANEFDGEFGRYNEFWEYGITIDPNRIVHDKFMNWLFQFITDDNLNNKILDKFIELEQYDIDFNNPPFYDENDKTPDSTKAYEKYAAFTDWLANKGGSQFLHKDANNVMTKAIAANHIIKILKSAAFNRDTSIVYNWFEHLAGSYSMAEMLIANPNKKVKVSKILPGYLNTEQTEDYVGTYLNEAVDGYNENLHQIGVIVDDPSNPGNRIATFSKDATGISIDNTVIPKTHNVVLRIPRPDGTYAYALCKQMPIKEVINKPNIQKLINGVLEEVRAAVQNYFQTEGEISFTQLQYRLENIFGNNALLRGIYIDRVSNGAITIKIVNGNTAKTLAYFNPTKAATSKSKGHSKNVTFLNDDGSKIIYYKNNTINAAQMLSNVIYNNLIERGTFAIGKNIINDGAYSDRAINPFIIRKDNKTIIRLGSYKEEYNSYQDFLVKNGLIKTKLQNDRTPRIISPGVIAYGNFVYSKNNSGLEIRLPVTVPKAPGTIPVVKEMVDVINMPLATENIDDIVDTVNDPDEFKKYISNLAETNGLLDNTIISYYNEIFDTGILKMPIAVKGRTNTKAFAYYDKLNEMVVIDRFRWMRHIRTNKPTIARFMNVIIHENIHGYIDMQNKAGNNMSKKITDAFIPIYKEYREWFDSQSEEFKNDKRNRTLARIKDDGSELKDIDYEEFMIEAMTNGMFMSQLNSIKTTPSEDVKKPTLFAKIMNIISKLFGININSDSLLAKARAAANSLIDKGGSAPLDTTSNIDDSSLETDDSTTEDDLQDSVEPEPEPTKEPTINKNLESDFEDDNIFGGRGGDMPFAETYDSFTLQESIDRLPYETQPKFNALIDDGSIGFACK